MPEASPALAAQTTAPPPLDGPAQAELVAAHRPLAVRLARRYSTGPAPDADLVQVAMLGLVLAARRYRADAGPFRPFAVATVAGELKRHLRNSGWWVHVPRSIQEHAALVDRTREVLQQRLGRSPTPQEMASEAALTVEEVVDALRALDLRFRRDQLSPDADPAAEPDDAATRVVIDGAVARLPAQDRHLLELRFGQELTQREIAAQLHISQTQVMRRLRSVTDRLRTMLADLDDVAVVPAGADPADADRACNR